MVFRSYTNVVSQASRKVAAGIFIVGMILIGFGFMIYLLPKFFATLAAIVFFLLGLSCSGTALKIFLAQKKMDSMMNNPPDDGRENVRIHNEENDVF